MSKKSGSKGKLRVKYKRPICRGSEHRCARGTYGLLMRRLKLRIYTPPSEGKKHPTPSNQFTPPQEIREIFLDFFYKFYVSCIYFTKFNWNKLFFKKKFACGGQYCFFDQNNALPPMYLNSISAIFSPFSFNILVRPYSSTSVQH